MSKSWKQGHKKLRRALLHAQKECCFYCFRRFDQSLKPTFDHLVPKYKGCRFVLVLACKECNENKGCSMPSKNEVGQFASLMGSKCIPKHWAERSIAEMKKLATVPRRQKRNG